MDATATCRCKVNLSRKMPISRGFSAAWAKKPNIIVSIASNLAPGFAVCGKLWRGAAFWTNQRQLSDTKIRAIILTPIKRRFRYSIFVLAVPHSRRPCVEVRHATKSCRLVGGISLHKLLSCSAAIVVIAAGAVYLTNEWTRYQNRVAGDRVRSELFRLADAAPNEDSKVTKYCQSFVEAAPYTDDQGIKSMARDCRFFGFH